MRESISSNEPLSAHDSECGFSGAIRRETRHKPGRLLRENDVPYSTDRVTAALV